MWNLSKKQLLYVFFLASLILGVQMSAIHRPFLGHYASYQGTVMASIARNMLRENFSDIFRPKTDVIINGQRSLHLNQYPFPSLVAALGIKLLGGTFEFWGRFQAICFNLLSIVVLALIANQLFGERTAWMSASIFALSPYTLIYGQSFMSESMALFFLLLSFYLILRTPSDRVGTLRSFASGFCFSIAVTGRTHFLFLFPVYFLYILFDKTKFKVLRLSIFSLLAFAMPIAWYAHTYFVSLQASNVHTNLFFQISSREQPEKFFLKNVDYYRAVFDTFSQMMLTPVLFPFFFLGLALIKKQGNAFWVLAGGLAFGSLVAVLAPEKVIKHDFYLYGIFPFVALVAAYGLRLFLDVFPILNTTRVVFFSLLLYFAVSSRFFLHPIFKHGERDENIASITKAIQANTKPDDRVIVAGNDVGPVLYYANRPGWPLQFSQVGKRLSGYLKNTHMARNNPAEIVELEAAMQDPATWIEYLRKQGALYLVIANAKELKTFPALEPYLKQHYQALFNDRDDFYLFRLAPPKS